MMELEKGNWPVETEVSLFHAMRGHKPVGVNKHFQMLFIHEKLNSSTSRKISSKDIWDHLCSMYDLQALNESEIIPFPNKETEFDLPVDEFKDLQSRDFPRFSSTHLDEKSEVKADPVSKSGKSEKIESKQIENKHTTSVLHANTPENSPKRKRTRNTPSANASPATPEVPPSKRRR